MPSRFQSQVRDPVLPRSVDRRREDLLAGVATDLLRFSNPERLLNSVFERLSQTAGIDVCCSHFSRPEGLDLIFLAGLPADTVSDAGRVELDMELRSAVSCQTALVTYNDLFESTASATSVLRGTGLNTLACHALCTADRLLGTLAFGSRTLPYFSPEDLQLQRAVADQLAIAFDRLILIEELARNNRELLIANTESKRAHAELEQIAVAISHDLREPVRHLSIYAELLQRFLQNRLAKDAEQYLRFILSSAKRVELLVSDLLEYTGISREEPSPGHVDTFAIASRVGDSLKRLIDQTGGRIHVDPLPPLQIAEDDLSMLLENLLENAIVHHHGSVPPDVRVFARASSDGPVLCVSDNGDGIDPRHQAAIFGLFHRLHPKQGVDRSGLGLSLCRKIVDRYHGRIWVESKPGEGALFCFTLHSQHFPRSFAAVH